MEPVAAAEPVTGEPVIDTALLLVDLLDALTGEEGMTDDVDGIQQTVDEIRQALDRPLMTTSFQDYTVTEGLLLLLLQCVCGSLCQDVKGGIFMAEVVSEFFTVVWMDMIPPDNLAELIPYLLSVFVSVALVSGVFRVIGRLAEVIMDFRRF